MTVQLCWDGEKFTRRYVVDWRITLWFTDLNLEDYDVLAYGDMLKRHPGQWYTVPDLTRKS